MSKTPRPGGLPPTDLSAAFGRASGLQARLGAPRSRASERHEGRSDEPGEAQPLGAPAADDVEEVQPQVGEGPGAGSASAGVASTAEADPAQDGAGPGQRPTTTRRDRSGAVVINTSVPLRRRMDAYLDETGASNAELLFDAIEETVEELPELWARAVRRPAAGGSKSLFDRQPVQQRESAEHLVGWYVSMSPANQGVLDQVVEQVTGGGSRKRTAVANLALAAFLDRWDQRGRTS